jgi:hypothetical protein
LRSDSAREEEALLFHLLERITGFEKRDLLALEALLFLIMVPFHYDDGKRQTAL